MSIKVWVNIMSIKVWVNIMSIKVWVNIMFIKVFVNIMSIKVWVNIMSIKVRVNIMSIKIWVNIMSIEDWVNIRSIKVWVNIRSIKVWVNIMSIKVWVNIMSIKVWVNIMSIKVWVIIMSIKVWVNIISIEHFRCITMLFYIQDAENCCSQKKHVRMSHTFILEDSENAIWVDLLLNPEQYTGYQGEGAHRIWSSIYKENCFFPDKKMHSYDDFKNLFLLKTCLEKRVFYRTVSGLHASINIHLSYKFLLYDNALTDKPVFGPNLEEFQKRFDPKTTNGNGKDSLLILFLLAIKCPIEGFYWL